TRSRRTSTTACCRSRWRRGRRPRRPTTGSTTRRPKRRRSSAVTARARGPLPLVDPHLLLAAAEGFGEGPVGALLDPSLDALEALANPPPDLPPRVRARLCASGLGAAAAALLADAHRAGLMVLTPDSAAWPPRLRDAPLRPLVLFARGDLGVLARAPAATVVGSRTPTPYGLHAAHEFAGALAQAGVVLWSGLARGIDAAAHHACLRARTPTVAVLAGGLD